MKTFAFVLTTGWLSVTACSSDSNQKNACEKLSACKISSSGLSCDNDKASACAECINDANCDDILRGHCAPDCPAVTFKPK
jgi:hypothetical protein